MQEPERGQREGQLTVVPGLGVVRPVAQGLLVGRQRLVHAARRLQHVPKVVRCRRHRRHVRRRACLRERHRRAVGGDALLEQAAALRQQAEGEVGGVGVRVLPQRLLRVPRRARRVGAVQRRPPDRRVLRRRQAGSAVASSAGEERGVGGGRALQHVVVAVLGGRGHRGRVLRPRRRPQRRRLPHQHRRQARGWRQQRRPPRRVLHQPPRVEPRDVATPGARRRVKLRQRLRREARRCGAVRQRRPPRPRRAVAVAEGPLGQQDS